MEFNGMDIAQGDTVVCLGEWDRDSILSTVRQQGSLAVVFGQEHFPQTLTASQMGQIYSKLYPSFSYKAYRDSLQNFHLSPDTPLTTAIDSFVSAVSIAVAQNATTLLYEIPSQDTEDMDWARVLPIAQRTLRPCASRTIQLCHRVEDYPYWEDTARLQVFSSGHCVISGQLSQVLADIGLCTCSLSELQGISPKDYIKKAQSGTEFRLLLSQKLHFSTLYPHCQVEDLTLLQMMSFFP